MKLLFRHFLFFGRKMKIFLRSASTFKANQIIFNKKDHLATSSVIYTTYNDSVHDNTSSTE